MSVMETQRVHDLLSEDFDLDLRITVAPDGTGVGQPRMDGWTTYTTCHPTCGSCNCGSSPTDSCGGAC
jgi:hypothetical protein